jgi:hypothetical protein
MRITFVFSLIILVSCHNDTIEKQDPAFDETAFKDSVKKAMKKDIDRQIANSMFDTIGVSIAPVKVISATLKKGEYSSYRDMYLTFKNVSGKKITAIRFKWYGINAFNEPADMGSLTMAGFGGGFTDDALLPGRSESSQWGINSKDGKKVVLAWPCEVAFEDGTKWVSK